MESPIEQKHISVINKYPAFRDSFVNGSWKWIEGKRKDDNANDLWRVHDKLYNLDDFISKHPGGKYWLEITKVSKLEDFPKEIIVKEIQPQTSFELSRLLR